jgi:hypothetical protein
VFNIKCIDFITKIVPDLKVYFTPEQEAEESGRI